MIARDDLCERCGYLLGGEFHREACGVTDVTTADDETPFSASSAFSATEAPYLVPNSAAFSGLAGDVVRAYEPLTEADPAAMLINTLVEFGSMVGPMSEARAGSAKHPPALFVALVGRSSRSRKGTSEREVSPLMAHVEEDWERRHRVGGFGSGEAFIEHAASEPGEAIYMVESELARVLVAASRDGSTASAVLRAAWDFSRLEHRVRKQKYEAPAAPVSLMAHITADELVDARRGLHLVEAMNGFGNRVLWVHVDRRRIIPSPEPIPEGVRNHLVVRLRAALDAARAAGVVRRSPEAEELWVDLYGQMADDDPVGIVGALTARAEAQVLRLSLLYALIDGQSTITRPHLESAWEFWRYCRWSAQHLWVGSGSGDPDVDRVVGILMAGEVLTSTALDRMFYGHGDIPKLRAKVVASGVAEEVSRPTGGRDAVVLRLAEKAEKAEKA
ncbi:MAG: YfjI family protein, partial [Actinomycetota bacterium]|nr:YfjI family protein [Actinomycetota bacterium]